MFWHIFSNRFRCLVRDRQLVFWTFLYPLVLATLFSLAFNNLSGSDLFTDIPVAVVDNAAYQSNTAFQSALTSSKLFHVSVVSMENAENLLKNKQIKGYILFDDGAKVVVKESGLEQSVIKQFMDSFLQTNSAYATIIQNQIQNGLHPVQLKQPGQTDYLQETAPGRTIPNDIIISYYALLAMASLFGGFWGRKEISDIQADLSPQGARLNLSPLPKLKTLAYSLSAAITLQFLSLLLLVGYLSLVLRVDFGNQMLYVLLVCLAGSVIGVTYGAVISAIFKKESMKTAGLVCLSMILSFLAGLMNPTVKYTVTQAVPILSYINPANLLTDALYSLYYYNTLSRFILDIGLVFAISACFILIVFFITRRQKYASL